MIKDLFGIQVTVNVINYVMRENIQIMKTVKCRKNLTGKLVEECRETIDEKVLHQNKMVYN